MSELTTLLPKVKRWTEGKVFDELDNLRGHGDRATFKQLVFQLLMLKCVTTSNAFMGKMYSRLSSQAAPIRSYAHVVGRLSHLNQYLLLSDNSPFEPIPNMSFDDELVRELASRIDALETNDPAKSPQLVFEHAVRWFARSEGRHGAESTTPESVANLLVELAAPKRGAILDPCCGYATLLIRAERFAKARGIDALNLHGQESDAGVRKLAQMNLVANNVKADLGNKAADSFTADFFPTLNADFIIANPPFNAAGQATSDTGKRESLTPYAGNHNFAWVQHFIKHMAPGGLAVFTGPNGSLSGTLCGNGKFRERMVRADLVDCIIALPKGLFDGPNIPACIWILANNKSCTHLNGPNLRVRIGETLFIDAQRSIKSSNRSKRFLDPEEISRIVNTYHAWNGLRPRIKYEDVPNFCRSATLEEIMAQGFFLSPNRYVESTGTESGAESVEERIRQLKRDLGAQLTASTRLNAEISELLQGLSDET